MNHFYIKGLLWGSVWGCPSPAGTFGDNWHGTACTWPWPTRCRAPSSAMCIFHSSLGGCSSRGRGLVCVPRSSASTNLIFGRAVTGYDVLEPGLSRLCLTTPLSGCTFVRTASPHRGVQGPGVLSRGTFPVITWTGDACQVSPQSRHHPSSPRVHGPSREVPGDHASLLLLPTFLPPNSSVHGGVCAPTMAVALARRGCFCFPCSVHGNESEP